MLPLDSMIGPTENKIYKCLQNLDYRVKKIKVVWDNTNAIIMYDDPIYTCNFSVKISALVHCIFSYCFAIVNEIITIKTRPNGQRNPS